MTAADQAEQGEQLGVDQAAAELGITTRRVRQLAAEGNLAGSRDAENRWMFPKAEVLRAKADRKPQPEGREVPGKPSGSVIDLRELGATVETAVGSALATALDAISEGKEIYVEQLTQALARAAAAEQLQAAAQADRDAIKAAAVKNADDWKTAYDTDTAALRKKATAAETSLAAKTAQLKAAEASRDEWRDAYNELLTYTPREFKRFAREEKQARDQEQTPS